MDTLRVIAGGMPRRDSDPEDVAISRRIKAHLASKGWKIEHLAVHTGVPFSTLAAYVTDNPARISATRLAKIAKALGCTADELLGLAPPDKPKRRTGTEG